MKRYYVDRNSDGEVETDLSLDRFGPLTNVYLAADVDARISELEKALEERYRAGYDDGYTAGVVAGATTD